MTRPSQPDLFAARRRAQTSGKRKPDTRQPPSKRKRRAALALYAPQRTTQDEPEQPQEAAE